MRKGKRILSVLLSAAMLLSMATGASAVPADASAETSIISDFQNPPTEAKGMFRYWLPDAAVTEEQLAREMQEMHAAGFAGVEIAHVPYSRIVGDLETNGWGTEAWRQAMIRVYKAANTVPGEFLVDMTINTQWPPALDNIDPNDEAASQELHMVTQKVSSAAAMELELPPIKLSTESGESFVFTSTFEAASLAKVRDVNEDGTLVLDYDSMEDVSGRVSETGETTPSGIPDPDNAYCQSLYPDGMDLSQWGNLPRLQDSQPYYQADMSGLSSLEGYVPSEGAEIQPGDYVLFSFYRRGTGDTVSPSGYFGTVLGVIGYSFATCGTVINEFSQEGVQALTDYWDNNILNEELISLMKERGGNFFEDSIETNTVTMFWNSTMLDAFEQVNGYDVTAYLPFLFTDLNGIASSVGNEQDFIEDFKLLEADRYINDHVKPMQEWAQDTVGYSMRIQGYTTTQGYMDEGWAAAVMDVAEGESLAFGKSFDKFRLLSTGTRTTGGNLLSDEALATGTPYTMTYDRAISTLNHEFAAGVNRILVHGYSYGNTENMNVEGKDDRDQWPGWCTFTSMAGDSWGSRNPSWQSIDLFTDYINRTQAVLQKGVQRNDLAVLTFPFDKTHESMAGASDGRSNDLSAYTALLDQGYSYEVYSEGVLNLDECTVTNGVLKADSSASKALILDNLEVLGYETAEKIYGMAKDGLPVVFAGKLPSSVMGSDAEYTGSVRGTDAALQKVLADTLALDNVAQVSSMDELFAWLDAQGIQANASYDQKNVRVNLHEDTDGSRYYYLYNDNAETIQVELSLAGTGVPYLMNAWTGEVSPIACYDVQDGRIFTTLTLEGNEARFVAISDNAEAFGSQESDLRAVSAEAPVEYTENGMAIRVTENGSYKVEFSDGSAEALDIQTVPDAQTLQNWNLSIESWAPDAEANQTDLTVSSKTTVDFGAAGLGLWKDIQATEEQLRTLGVSSMNDVSGIATYSTILVLPEDWNASAQGYLMNVSHNNDMVTNVWVNGTAIKSISQVNDTIDIGAYLQPGENSIQIELTSTLLNRVIYEAKDHPRSLFKLLAGMIIRPVSFGITEVDLTPYAVVPVYQTPETPAVLSASAPESAQVGSDFAVTVVTAGSVTDVRLYNEYDLAIGAKNISVAENEDGTKTWRLTVSLGTVGDRAFKVVTKGPESYYKDSGVTVPVEITSVAPVLSSFDLPEAAVANRTFIMKATTDMAATKIAVYNEFGAKMGIRSLSYKVVDGQKVWTGVMAIGTKGERTFTAYAVNKYGAQSEAVTDSVSVKAFA